jgi:ankyrin repeat protein
LIARRCSSFEASKVQGKTALHYAVFNGLARSCKALLAAKANQNAAVAASDTPLLIAARRGFPLICHDLLLSGADARAENKRGENALQLAESFARDAAAKLQLIAIITEGLQREAAAAIAAKTLANRDIAAPCFVNNALFDINLVGEINSYVVQPPRT